MIQYAVRPGQSPRNRLHPFVSVVDTERNTYTCDLCGAEREESDLRQLHGDPPSGVSAGHLRPAIKADICGGCLDRPVRDVLAFIEKAEADAGFRRITVRRVAG